MAQYGKPVDLAEASKTLAGARTTALDVDYLGVDVSSCFAMFLGDDSESYRPPADADVVSTSKLIETVRTLFDARAAGAGQPAYRRTARTDAGEPIFDVPRTSV